MQKNISRIKKFLLFSIVIFLFLLSIIKTLDILKIANTQNNKMKNGEKTVSDISLKNISYIPNENNFQTITNEYGLFSYDNDYLFYNKEENNKTSLVKYNLETEEVTPLSTNLKIKNMIDFKENIYGTISSANTDDILKDYIVNIKKDASDTKVFYKTESANITSMIFDSENIYYTNETNIVFYLNTKTEEVSTLFVCDKTADCPILLGINENELIFVNGKEIAAIDLEKSTTRTISSEYSSKYLSPKIINDEIIMFSDLNHSDIISIDINSLEKKILIKNDYFYEFVKENNMKLFNIVENYLFVSTNDKLYYYDLTNKDGIFEYKGIVPKDGLFYILDNAIIANDEKINISYINWLTSK